jgi:hypothetical protein
MTKMLTGRYIIESRLRRKDLLCSLRRIYFSPYIVSQGATLRAKKGPARKKSPSPPMKLASGGDSL